MERLGSQSRFDVLRARRYQRGPWIKAHDAFDDSATGIDLYGEYRINERALLLVGYNFVDFNGDSTAVSGVNVAADDLEASALYTGLKWEALNYEGFSLYGRGEIGFGFTDDVDYKLSAQPGFALTVNPSQKAF